MSANLTDKYLPPTQVHGMRPSTPKACAFRAYISAPRGGGTFGTAGIAVRHYGSYLATNIGLAQQVAQTESRVIGVDNYIQDARHRHVGQMFVAVHISNA